MSGEKMYKTGADEWQCNSPFEFVRTTDWTITNFSINAKSVWLLKQANTEHGSFKSAEEAKRRDAELSDCSHRGLECVSTPIRRSEHGVPPKPVHSKSSETKV
jgi:hypothetical protein